MSVKEEIVCSICKGIIDPEDLFCNNCGASLKENNQMIQEQKIIESPSVQSLYTPYRLVQTIQPKTQPDKNTVYAIVSLIFTSIAALLFLIPCPCISIFGGLPVSAIGLILGIVAVAIKPRKTIDWLAFSFSLAAPAIWGIIHIIMYGFYIY